MNVLRHSLAGLTALGLAPMAAVALALRSDWRAGWRDRLGIARRGSPGGIWIHAASVGEVLAAGSLVECLEDAGERVYVSTMTDAALGVVREQVGNAACGLAPVDHPWAVDGALDRVGPDLIALVETELWPIWIAAARRREIPVVVVSGRLSDSSFSRYFRLRSIFRPTFRRLSAVGARSELDAERFVALGVPDDRVCVTGDLKLASKRAGVGLPGDLARALSGAPVVVAGSTHAGEERAALSALDRCEGEGVDAALVLAPRQLSRVDQVLEEVREAGRAAIRRSALDGAVLESGQVLILDSLGELAGVYAAAAAAFVGGTLAPVGGHNLFEPMSVGCPVVFGPYIQNIRSAAELAIQSRAGLEVADSRALAAALCDLLRDPSERRARGAAGRAALERQRDTPLRNAEVIFRTLGRKRGPAAPAAPVSVCSSDEATR